MHLRGRRHLCTRHFKTLDILLPHARPTQNTSPFDSQTRESPGRKAAEFSEKSTETLLLQGGAGCRSRRSRSPGSAHLGLEEQGKDAELGGCGSIETEGCSHVAREIHTRPERSTPTGLSQGGTGPASIDVSTWQDVYF